MRQKHDSPTNWRETKSFVPKAGEIIVYDKDSFSRDQRLKIGDGETLVNDLNMLTGEVYTQKQEPLDAGEGAVWIKADEVSDNEDYGAVDEVIGYKYNGVFLPYLPNWNKVMYPNGFINIVDGITSLYITREEPLPLYDESSVFNGLKFVLEKKDGIVTYYHYREWTYNVDTNTWNTDGLEHTVQKAIFPNVIWTYKNILNSGTIAFKSTQPIPVYHFQEEIKRSDWNIPNKERAGYIYNRPVWREQNHVSLSWNPDADLVDITDELKMYHMSNLHPGINEMMDIDIYTNIGPIPYTDVSLPDFFEYNEESYPKNITRFCYDKDSESWKELYYYYSSSSFQYNQKEEAVTNQSDTFLRVFNKENNSWGEEIILPQNTNIFQPKAEGEAFFRFASNFNILDDSGSIVYQANHLTPIEGGQQQQVNLSIMATKQDLIDQMTEENVDSNKIFILNGAALGMASSHLFLTTFITANEEPTICYLGCIIKPTTNEKLPQGIYFTANSETEPYIARFNFNYSAIEVNSNYKNVFKHQDATNIFTLDKAVLLNLMSAIDGKEEVEKVLQAFSAEMTRFNPGEVLLIPSSFLEALNSVN